MIELLEWWQQLPLKMDPVIFRMGPIKLQYYGLMYIIAFGLTYFLVLFRLRREKGFRATRTQITDLTTYMIFGLIIGARLGYVLFYNLPYYWKHPLEIFLPFEFSSGVRFVGFSGMSYHGGLIGVILASWWYIGRARLSFWKMVDLYVPVIPLGYTFGRIGNFINGELYGRITTAPIGMIFPQAPTPHFRHPSQLYEAFFEGLFLFTVLWSLRKIRSPQGAMLAYYLAGYGIVRFIIEYFRQPDAHLGFVWLSFSMGQILCLLMTLSGLPLFVFLWQHRDRV